MVSTIIVLILLLLFQNLHLTTLIWVSILMY